MIKVENLQKRIPMAGTELEILKGITLEIKSGESVAIVGASGSGKSTLLGLLAGLDEASGGRVIIGDTDLGELDEDGRALFRGRHVGFVFQLYNLLPALTAEGNVELPLLLTSLSRKERREHVAAALKLVSLSDRARHYPRQLSGGQEQRAGIARAIVNDPTLILADEPTGDLDRKSGDEILDLLQALNKEHGKTIIMVTHDPLAAKRASRTLHLDKGVLQDEGQEASSQVVSAGTSS